MRNEYVYGLLRLRLINGEHHSYTHIENIEHLPVGDTAIFLEEMEYRQDLPAAFPDLDTLALVEYTRDILVKSASGYMGHPVHIAVADDIKHLLHIYPGRGKGHIPEDLSIKFRIGGIEIKRIVGKYLADQAEPVGMDTRRGNPDQHITDLDPGSIDKFRFLDHTCRETGDIIFAICIHPGHLGCLATYKSTAGLAASFCHTRYYCLDLPRLVMSDCDIVKEEERLCSLGQYIIDTHCHGIDTDSVVSVHRKGQLEFGADAISAAYKHRFLHIQSRKVKHSAE